MGKNTGRDKMSIDRRPILGISVGDPGGIGPEITAKALNLKEIYDLSRPLAVADYRVMQDALKFSGVNLTPHAVQQVRDARFEHGALDILDMKNMPMDRLRYKEVSAEQGNASFEYVAKVIDLAMSG
jgi:4-hydroxy-L-threonine phosphate dehydrogenase PdxA